MPEKVIMLGDCGVGKTCIVNCYKTGSVIEEDMATTINVDCVYKEEVCGIQRIKVQSHGWF